MRILMVGAGATGGYFGARLVQAGRDVTFLLRDHRAQQVLEHGLQIVSPHGDVTVHPRIVTATDLREQPELFDVVILSTKSYQLDGAMNDIAPAVGPHTMLLPILNGMRQLAVLDARFGAERVLGGSVRIHADVTDAGRVLQRNRLQQFSYGERSRERTPRILALDEVLRDAGFTATLQSDILDAMWQKWIVLASLGSICVLARGTVGQAVSAPHGALFTRAVVAECAAIATANGYPPDATLLREHLERMTDAESPLTSSLYRDMTKGAPVEADHVLGDLLNRAKDVAAPLVTAAYVQLKVYEAGRKAQVRRSAHYPNRTASPIRNAPVRSTLAYMPTRPSWARARCRRISGSASVVSGWSDTIRQRGMRSCTRSSGPAASAKQSILPANLSSAKGSSPSSARMRLERKRCGSTARPNSSLNARSVAVERSATGRTSVSGRSGEQRRLSRASFGPTAARTGSSSSRMLAYSAGDVSGNVRPSGAVTCGTGSPSP